MKLSQKEFIQRQIQVLAEQGRSNEEILTKSLAIFDSETKTQSALKLYSDLGSFSETLHRLQIINIDRDVLKIVTAHEKNLKDGNSKGIQISKFLLDSENTIQEAYRLLKLRLYVGLGYAMWLVFVASSVFSIIGLKVFPMVENFFVENYAELPQFTKLAIRWHDSFLSPGVIGLILVSVITVVFISINSQSRYFRGKIQLSKLPFLKNVTQFTNCIRWLTYLRIITTTGMTLDEAINKISVQINIIKSYLPDFLHELKTAEKIGTLENEFIFQIKKLEDLAEKTITASSRNLVNVIMIVVVIYVVFSLIATYLPIFQMGSVI